jgi:dUTP pyrophosphatase
LSAEDFLVNPGERICQMVINKVESISWEAVDSLEDTDRGAGGFGHTGL